MNKDLHKRVLDTIGRHAMIGPGGRLGIGVSGGADSVAMLRVFAELRTRLGSRFLFYISTISCGERKQTKTNAS